MRGLSDRGARRSARTGLLGQYVEHRGQAQRRYDGPIACLRRHVVRHAGSPVTTGAPACRSARRAECSGSFPTCYPADVTLRCVALSLCVLSLANAEKLARIPRPHPPRRLLGNRPAHRVGPRQERRLEDAARGRGLVLAHRLGRPHLPHHGEGRRDIVPRAGSRHGQRRDPLGPSVCSDKTRLQKRRAEFVRLADAGHRRRDACSLCSAAAASRRSTSRARSCGPTATSISSPSTGSARRRSSTRIRLIVTFDPVEPHRPQRAHRLESALERRCDLGASIRRTGKAGLGGQAWAVAAGSRDAEPDGRRRRGCSSSPARAT